MAFSLTLPSIDESRLDSIKALIVAKLSDLNAALTRDSATPIPTSITSACVVIGDPDRLPGDASTYPIVIAITGGDDSNPLDMESTQYLLDQGNDTGGARNFYYTTIRLYLHYDLFNDSDVLRQAERRERMLSRCCDWMVADVLNTAANRVITLGSRQFRSAPAYDQLLLCHCTSVEKRTYAKSINANNAVRGAEFSHVGQII